MTTEPKHPADPSGAAGSDKPVRDDITDVAGVRVGHAHDENAKTGVTAILFPPRGVPAGAHTAGFATSTRQVDSLGPSHVVNRIHGFLLCGGSAFGLDATGGALSYLEQAGVGIPVTGKAIPIVPSAAIFDLNFGLWRTRPDGPMGWAACEAATDGPIEQGSVGVGMGATVGKLFGAARGMKGGVGSASVIEDDLVVGALVVVNAFGDVRDAGGRIIAGARAAPDSLELIDADALLRAGKARSINVSAENTTLAVVAVNAALDKTNAMRVASQASLGMGRVISPCHSLVDGDLTVVAAVGAKDADPVRVGLLAVEAVRQAGLNAVTRADGFGILPAVRDMPNTR